MLDDEALWMRTVEAALASGRGFVEALEAADGTMASYWRTQRTTRRPGLAKCEPDEALPARHASGGGSPRPLDPAARTAAR
jgi:hypothetical protein